MPPADLNTMLRQFEGMIRAVASDPGIDDDELRRVLRFVSKMVQVVNQAFNNVYPLLIEVKYLRPEQLGTPRYQEVVKELELLVARDYYRDIELICGQLIELQQQYRTYIEPIIGTLGEGTKENFADIFALLEHHEGHILMLVKGITWSTIGKLEQAKDIEGLQEAQREATETARGIKKSLDELQLISNKILGLSGKQGFLELTRTDRLQIRDEIRYDFNYTDNRIHTGNVTGHQVAIGRDINQEIHTETTNGLDAAAVRQLIDALMQDIRAEGLPASEEESVIKKLEVTREELEEAEPDKEYIRKNLEKVTDTMEKAGKLIDQGSSIGLKLLKIGKWIGTAVAFF